MKVLPSRDVYLATYRNKLNASDCIPFDTMQFFVWNVFSLHLHQFTPIYIYTFILYSYTNNRAHIPKTDILYVFINSSLNRVGHA